MVREGRDFIVQDAKTGEDITRAVLTQIIFEQENSGGQTLLPTQFLRRLIRYYGDQMQSFVPSYLEASIEAFARSQEQWRDQVTRAWGGVAPINAFEEQARQNMQMFEQAMRVWAPFGATPPGAPAPKTEAETPADPDSITDLRRQMEAMQRQLDQLAQSRKQ
jgi:polyhydroxyalkanoate synthesis repressor PhaR